MRKKKRSNNISSVMAAWSWQRSKLQIEQWYKTAAVKLFYLILISRAREDGEKYKECRTRMITLVMTWKLRATILCTTTASCLWVHLRMIGDSACYDVFYNSRSTRHVHTATPIQKPPLAEPSDGVGEHHGGETITVETERSTYCVQGCMPHVHTL